MSEDLAECPICMESIPILYEGKCNHCNNRFHLTCMKRWGESCAMCRGIITFTGPLRSYSPIIIGIVGTPMFNSIIEEIDDDDDIFDGDFEGENTYLVSQGINMDDEHLQDIMQYRNMPTGNVFAQCTKDNLENIYNTIKGKYDKSISEGSTPVNSLLTLENCTFNNPIENDMLRILYKIFYYSRHILMSVVITSEKYSDLLQYCKENYTSLVLFDCCGRDINLIYQDIGVRGVTMIEFREIFRKKLFYSKYTVINRKDIHDLPTLLGY